MRNVRQLAVTTRELIPAAARLCLSWHRWWCEPPRSSPDRRPGETNRYRALNVRMQMTSTRWWPCIAYAAVLAILLIFLPGSAQTPVAAPVMDDPIEAIVASNLAPAATADHP